jgi:catechol 2,3-dioxygenase-like lactoylglutathione lyase family enzyme
MTTKALPIALAALILAATPSGATSPLPPPVPLPPVEASLLVPALRVRDAPDMAGWYRTVLDMRVIMERDAGQVHETILAFASTPERPGVILLNRKPGASRHNWQRGGSRLILRVTNIDAVIARLDAAGMAHETPHQPLPGYKVLNLSDPEGNELELVQTAQR